MRLPLAVLLITTAACGGADPSVPPEIRWGLDECSHCRMIIDEPRYAAAGRGPDGEEVRFDDLFGVRERFAGNGAESWRIWVQTEKGWVPAESAWFVRDPEELTPMASGLLAFADREAAERRAELTETEVLDWPRFLKSSVSGLSDKP